MRIAVGCVGGRGIFFPSSRVWWTSVLWSSWRVASPQTVGSFPGPQKQKPITSDSSVVFWSVCHVVSWHVGRLLESPRYDSLLASHLSRVASTARRPSCPTKEEKKRGKDGSLFGWVFLAGRCASRSVRIASSRLEARGVLWGCPLWILTPLSFK